MSLNFSPAVALPTFIYFKRKNDRKAREKYAETRVKTGALSQMTTGACHRTLSELKPVLTQVAVRAGEKI